MAVDLPPRDAPPPAGSTRASRLAPWAGLIAAFAGVMVQHQGIGDALHYRCGPAVNRADLIAGVIALLLMAIGALVSWRVLRADVDATGTRRFIAQISLMAVALFALMVVWQTLAGVLEPSCP